MRRCFISFALMMLFIHASVAQKDCLFKNPLCFYNTDILTYLQVLYKNQQYEKMARFFYGPYLQNNKIESFTKSLSEAEFGYSFKRVGVKKKSPSKWSLTYQRTILSTNETFKIDCDIVNDTCRIFLDKNKWNTIFKDVLNRQYPYISK